jgi:hypothetical protein
MNIIPTSEKVKCPSCQKDYSGASVTLPCGFTICSGCADLLADKSQSPFICKMCSRSHPIGSELSLVPLINTSALDSAGKQPYLTQKSLIEKRGDSPQPSTNQILIDQLRSSLSGNKVAEKRDPESEKVPQNLTNEISNQILINQLSSLINNDSKKNETEGNSSKNELPSTSDEAKLSEKTIELKNLLNSIANRVENVKMTIQHSNEEIKSHFERIRNEIFLSKVVMVDKINKESERLVNETHAAEKDFAAKLSSTSEISMKLDSVEKNANTFKEKCSDLLKSPQVQQQKLDMSLHEAQTCATQVELIKERVDLTLGDMKRVSLNVKEYDRNASLIGNINLGAAYHPRINLSELKKIDYYKELQIDSDKIKRNSLRYEILDNTNLIIAYIDSRSQFLSINLLSKEGKFKSSTNIPIQCEFYILKQEINSIFVYYSTKFENILSIFSENLQLTKRSVVSPKVAHMGVYNSRIYCLEERRSYYIIFVYDSRLIFLKSAIFNFSNSFTGKILQVEIRNNNFYVYTDENRLNLVNFLNFKLIDSYLLSAEKFAIDLDNQLIAMDAFKFLNYYSMEENGRGLTQARRVHLVNINPSLTFVYNYVNNELCFVSRNEIIFYKK